MGSFDQLSGLGGVVGDLGDLLHIFVGLLKGDLTVLSTDGSLTGIFGSTSGE